MKKKDNFELTISWTDDNSTKLSFLKNKKNKKKSYYVDLFNDFISFALLNVAALHEYATCLFFPPSLLSIDMNLI